jgi:hypothetical protein
VVSITKNQLKIEFLAIKPTRKPIFRLPWAQVRQAARELTYQRRSAHLKNELSGNQALVVGGGYRVPNGVLSLIEWIFQKMKQKSETKQDREACDGDGKAVAAG